MFNPIDIVSEWNLNHQLILAARLDFAQTQ
jgi:hypothetical protein